MKDCITDFADSFQIVKAEDDFACFFRCLAYYSEEFFDKLYCLTDFVLRSESDRDQITGLHVFRDELKALVGGNPPSTENLVRMKGLGVFRTTLIRSCTLSVPS